MILSSCNQLPAFPQLTDVSPANDASAKYLPFVRVTGWPSNIIEETRLFDIYGAQWISFPNQQTAFFWSGMIPVLN